MNVKPTQWISCQSFRSIIALLLLLGLLTQCVPAPSGVDTQPGNCQPTDRSPTPPAVTVPPAGALTATPSHTVLPLPATTPSSPCPLPGTAVIPRSSPVPPPPAYPTLAPRRWLTGSDVQTAFQLPGTAQAIDLAVHPTEGWPVVGVLQHLNLMSDPLRAFVRVYQPQSHTWGVAQQVDVGAASNGTDRSGSIVVGVTGDRAVHAVWGGSDDDGGLWISSSIDFGARWSAPQRIATNCWSANAMATTPDGQIVVQATCYTTPAAPRPQATQIVRTADGAWLPPEATDVPGWFGTVVIAGDGRDALATAFITAKGVGENEQVMYVLSKYLVNRGAPWQVRQIPIAPLGVPAGEAGESHWHLRALAFSRPQPSGGAHTGLILTWSGQYRASVYALVSLDGGLTFGPIVPIVYYPDPVEETGREIAWSAPAYDLAADRLAAIWLCCANAQQHPGSASTHYASWSAPGALGWSPPHGPLDASPLVPLLTGARSAAWTVSAQIPMARWTWLAWVEQGNQVIVRSLDLDTIIPVNQYVSTPVAQGGL